MEKVFINPVAKEILVKGNTKEGPVDLFSYDNNGNNRALGNLFVVGNIQGGSAENSDDIDVGYVLNLVASLAKREYYLDQNASPKEAFSCALKKINGVVEEFFKNKETKINIGIFAVAGDQIHISKLGKFKILLARDGKNIDILNNIQLFDKETTQEKEFSNIISGKIMEGDRVLAFYPNRSTTAREKSIKESLLKSSQDDFVTQLTSIKETKPEFACAALHLDIQRGIEITEEPNIQPKELREEKVEAEDLAPAVSLASTDTMLDDENELEEEKIIPEVKTVSKLSPEPAIPKIIPSEFARGKREIFLSKHLRNLKNINVTPKQKMYVMGGVALVALLTIFSLKSLVFVDSATRELNTTISEIQANVKLAQEKSGQSDFVSARNLLVGSLSTIARIESESGSSGKINDTKNQVITALDALDNATDATLSVVADIPVDSGTAKLITSQSNNFYVYLDQKESASISKIVDGSISGSVPVKDTAPSAMFNSDAYVALVDTSANKISSLSIAKGTLTTKSFTSDPLVGMEIYQDNFYGLTDTNIIKITDAALGKTDVQPWLADGTSLSTGSSLLAVDGNIYVLSSNGTLATYYKGKKKTEITTPISPSPNLSGQTGSMLLTTTNSPNLYLINIPTGRIYIFDKITGTVSKTLKINSAEAVSSATLSADGTIYILSNNKIWKVQ